MKDSGQIKVNEKIITTDLLNNYTQYSGPHQWRVEHLSLFIQAIYSVCTKQESLSLFWGSFKKTENATVPFNLSSVISLRNACFNKKKKTEQLWSRTTVAFSVFSFLNMTKDHKSHLKRCYHYPRLIVDILVSCKGTSTGQKDKKREVHLLLYQQKSEEECYSHCREHKAAGRKPAFHIL